MKSSFVVDCSLAMTWCFAEEATPATDQLLARMKSETAAVPAWWFIEVANVLVLAERKKRITASEIARFIKSIERFDFEIDNDSPSRAFSELIPMSRNYNLTSYDAVYLDLALRLQIPLATLDEELRAAAKSAGIALFGK